MPMHFTFLLLFSLTSLLFSENSIQKVHFSFEVLQVKNNYRDILEKRAKQLSQKGFTCHVLTLKDRLSLRCNDINDTRDLAPTIEKFKDENVSYTIINLTKRFQKNIVGKQIPLYIGYHAYKQKNYSKALDIFYANYSKKKSLKNAKAYALALFKLGNYRKSLEVLTPYNHTPQIEKIYKDVITTYVDLLIKKGNFTEAKESITKANLSPAKKMRLNDKINYMHALVLNKQKMYDASTKLILSIDNQNRKTEKVLIGNQLALSAQALKSKNYTKALSILEPYRSRSEDAEKFSQEIVYYHSLELGWKSLSRNPRKALKYFKRCYALKSSDVCMEGQMYSYDKLSMSAKAIALAQKLYAKEPKDKYLKILIKNYMREKKSNRAKYYYALLKDKQGVENPQQNQIVALTYKYLKAGELKRAKKMVKRINNLKIKNDIHRHLVGLQKSIAMNKLFDYNKKNSYRQCYTYAKKLSSIYNDTNINRIGGWCAYHDAKYGIAKEFFEDLIKDDTQKKRDDIYALALIFHKLGNDARADEVLGQIRDYSGHIGPISLLYSDMGESRKAKEILVESKDPSVYKELIREINKNTKYPTPITQAAGGFSYHRNKGTKGTSYLEVTSLPIDIDYLSFDGFHLYGDFDLLHLSNGVLGSAAYRAFGFGKTVDPYHITQADSVEGVVGFKSKDFQAEIGLTPIGLDISPQLVGKIYSHHQWEKLDLHAALEQKAIKESFLSYVGQSTNLDGKRYDWGRILKRGATIGFSHDGNTTYTMDLFYYPKIYGENSMENSETKAVATAVYHTATTHYAFLDFGATVVYDSFEKNSDLFTYGHGGYFSPQDFWLGSIGIDIADYIGENGYYRFQGSIGYQTFSVGAIEKFPLSSNPPYSSIEDGYKKSGATFKTSLQLGYALSEHLNLSAGVHWEKGYGYDLLQVGVALSYHFGRQKNASLKRLRDAHNIDQMIP